MAHVSMNCSLVLDQECPSVIPIHRFSTFSRLLRVTSLVYKFLAIKLGRIWDNNSKAAIYWMKLLQRQEFSAETEYLQEPMRNQEPIRVRALDLFLDFDGLIRSRGRLDRLSHLAYEVKKSHFARETSPCYKTRYCRLPCELFSFWELEQPWQSGYWVPQGRQAVNKVLASCARCKRYNSKPVLPNTVASLPASRAHFEVPFQHTGVDFTGHVWVKDGSSD